MKNEKLKTALRKAGITYADISKRMGINQEVFANKINNRVVNGHTQSFKPVEKMWLANELKIKENEIE